MTLGRAVGKDLALGYTGVTEGVGRPEHQGQMVWTGWHSQKMAGRGAHREQSPSCFWDGLHSPFQSQFSHRIHLMAGRVPQGADRAAVRSEMETVFLENLRHAAGVLTQVREQRRHIHILK